MRIAVLALLGLSLAFPAFAEAPPSRTLSFTTREGTWMHPDLSPDGRTILTDILGDIYAMDSQGGAARPLFSGPAFESQPVYSPDGTLIAFISDRSGVTNLWIAKADGSEPRMVSGENSLNVMAAPSWSPDGRTIYVSRMVHSVLTFEIWAFDLDGKGARQITRAGSENWDERMNALGPVASPDGRYLYYAVKQGHTWTFTDPPVWSVARRDLRTGADETVVSGAGGAMSPALSHDGRTLAYAARDGQRTVIRLRDLEFGEDRILGPIDHDGQEQGYYAGLTPRFAFTADDKALMLSIDGGLAMMDVASGARRELPFSADVNLTIGPDTRLSIPEETGPVRVRMAQAPKLSPDGARFAFTALGGLYVQDRSGGAPRRIVEAGDTAFQPAWTPDGRALAYVTWSRQEGGAVWIVPVEGGQPGRVSASSSFYTEPVFLPDGGLVALRASRYDRLHALNELSPARATDVVRLSLDGGPERRLAHAFGARLLGVSRDGKSLRVYTPAGVAAVPVEGGDLKPVLSVVVQSPSQYVGVPMAADEVRLNPAGDLALVRHWSQLWLVGAPEPDSEGETPRIDLTTSPANAVRITRVGADFADWSTDGQSLVWSVGSTIRTAQVAGLDRQSVGSAEAAADLIEAVVTVPRDTPEGAVLLRGATALTMRGDEVIRNADLLIDRDRIVAIGPRGEVDVPSDARIVDVRGKVITPGLVDAHAHWTAIRRQVQESDPWELAVNLAFGVTSGLDVQPFTSDMFVYQDMVDAGMTRGPRAWSTGPGVFRNSPNDTEADIAAVLSRYRDHYRTRNIKAYMVGDRAVRQRMARVVAQEGVMATTEGASDLYLNLTHFMDGFAGNEHAVPVTPLRDDVIRLMAETRTSYTPTLEVLYGGWPALFEQIIDNRPQDDPRLQRFVPPEVMVEKLRERHWAPKEAQTYALFAADALRVQRAGGLVGMGSHGEIQGLGLHWEMAAYVEGGATPMEALHAATMGSAETIGRASEVGSLEPGKFADLLILDADPRASIVNTRLLHWVMKGGRLYDPMTLEIVEPKP